MGDWKEIRDPKSGRNYYHSKKLNKTTWKKPTDFLGGSPPLRFWKRADPKSGKVYYINTKTKATSWKLPAGGTIVPLRIRSKKQPTRAETQETVHIDRTGSVDMHFGKRASEVDPTLRARTSAARTTTYGNTLVKSPTNSPGSSTKPSKRTAFSTSTKPASTPTPAPTRSGSLRTTTDRIKAHMHMGKDGEISIEEMDMVTGKTEQIHISKMGSVDITQDGRTMRSIRSNLGSGQGGGDASGASPASANSTSPRRDYASSDALIAATLKRSAAATAAGSPTSSPERAALGGYQIQELWGDARTSGRSRRTPYDNVLGEAKTMQNESLAHEERVAKLQDELHAFNVGIKAALAKSSEMLAAMNKINQRHETNEQKVAMNHQLIEKYGLNPQLTKAVIGVGAGMG